MGIRKREWLVVATVALSGVGPFFAADHFVDSHDWVPVHEPFTETDAPVEAEFVADQSVPYRIEVVIPAVDDEHFLPCVFGILEEGCPQPGGVTVEWEVSENGAAPVTGIAKGVNRFSTRSEMAYGSFVHSFSATEGSAYRVKALLHGGHDVITSAQPVLRVAVDPGFHSDAMVVRELTWFIALVSIAASFVLLLVLVCVKRLGKRS